MTQDKIHSSFTFLYDRFSYGNTAQRLKYIMPLIAQTLNQTQPGKPTHLADKVVYQFRKMIAPEKASELRKDESGLHRKISGGLKDISLKVAGVRSDYNILPVMKVLVGYGCKTPMASVKKQMFLDAATILEALPTGKGLKPDQGTEVAKLVVSTLDATAADQIGPGTLLNSYVETRKELGLKTDIGEIEEDVYRIDQEYSRHLLPLTEGMTEQDFQQSRFQRMIAFRLPQLLTS